jgi:peptidoglycan/LPS O-acetylase OafA/YrhL
MMLNEQLRQAAHPLNALRLGLGIAVIIAHSSPIAGICCEPMVPFNPDVTLRGAATGAFFALSGLLVTMSAMRYSGQDFLLARMRRIVPGYLLVLGATTLVLAPIIFVQTNGSLEGFALTGEKGALTYLFQYLLFGWFAQQNVNDVFYSGTWLNLSLWAIKAVVRFYLVIFVLVEIGKSYGITKVVGIALGVNVALIAAQAVNPELVAAVMPEYLPSFRVVTIFPFMCGALLGTLADRIRVNHVVGIGAIVVLVGATVTSGAVLQTIGYGSLALVIPYLAWLLPTRPFRWFANDLSYGTFLWGFPVAQVLAFAGLNSLGLAPFALLSVLCTLPFAALSWFLVERRFVNTKDRYEVVRGETFA